MFKALQPVHIYVAIIVIPVIQFYKCIKMAKEVYFVDSLVSIKYNKTLITLPLHLYECIQLLMRVS